MQFVSRSWVFGERKGFCAISIPEDVGILELRIHESLWRAKRWLDNRGLEMAMEKTETLLLTERRSFKYMKIVLDG